MKKGIAVSVVVPVWNPGEGIRRCISSLRRQTLDNIEMIFVDDRGTDGAVELIEAAAAQDPRVRLLHNPQNLGPGASRNAGIEAAEGEYLSFIDPDDYVADDFFQRLYSKAKAEDLDVVKGRILYQKEDGSIAPHHEQNDTIRRGLAAGKPPYAVFTYEHHSAVYRREMLMRSGARYGLARRAQDTTFLLRACHAAKNLGLDDGALYYFCERQDSAMHVFNSKSLEQRLFSFEEQVDYLSAALGGDPWAPDYTVGLFLSNLRFYSCYEGAPGAEPLCREYCEGLRTQLLRLPYLDDVKKRCFSARALADYGEPLPTVPGFLPWESASPEGWLAVVGRWVDFTRAHPECAKSVAPALTRICANARQACADQMKNDPQAGQTLRAVEAQLRRLPLSCRVAGKTRGLAAWLKKRIKASC